MPTSLVRSKRLTSSKSRAMGKQQRRDSSSNSHEDDLDPDSDKQPFVFMFATDNLLDSAHMPVEVR